MPFLLPNEPEEPERTQLERTELEGRTAVLAPERTVLARERIELAPERIVVEQACIQRSRNLHRLGSCK